MTPASALELARALAYERGGTYANEIFVLAWRVAFPVGRVGGYGTDLRCERTAVAHLSVNLMEWAAALQSALGDAGGATTASTRKETELAADTEAFLTWRQGQEKQHDGGES